MEAAARVTAYAEVLPDGQKTTAAIVEYGRELRRGVFDAGVYTAQGRTVTAAYTCRQPGKGAGVSDGRFVIVELSPDDGTASTIKNGPLKGPGPGTGPPKGHDFRAGPPQMEHIEPFVTITQNRPLAALDGSLVKFEGALRSEKAVQEIVDDFSQFTLEGIPYNLYTPRGCDPEKKYPLVMFLHDAGPTGFDPLLTLTQGIGATCFARPAFQSKHPCFVLAPQIPPGLRPLEEESDRDIATVMKRVLDHVTAEYGVDTGRIYATGQSGGCMASCELNHRYPDLFAASLLVAGQWNPDRMRNTKDNRYWILVSEHDERAYPGMTAVTGALEEEGARVFRYTCDAKGGSEYLERLAREAAEKECSVRFGVFAGDSVVPDGIRPSPASNHICTWRAAYAIETVLDWLFTNKKGERA